MQHKTRLFVTLWLAGLAGVLSFGLVDLNALVLILPIPAGTEVPTITPVIKLLSLIQSALILSVAVLIGAALAPQVGLSSPVAQAIAGGGELSSAFKPQFIPGILGGLAGGLAIILTAFLAKLLLPLAVITRIAALGQILPLPTRLLYGGIVEELLLRWGLMTLLVWAAWRLLQKGQSKPKAGFFVGAIAVSSVVFAVGHLPLAFMLLPEANLVLTLYVIVANSMFGFIAGYLFWKKGLESAMIAHMVTHLVLFTASYFGAYF